MTMPMWAPAGTGFPFPPDYARDTTQTRRRRGARFGGIRPPTRMAGAPRESADRPLHGRGRRAAALPRARRGHAARHAPWKRQHDPGAQAERPLRARIDPIPRDRPRPAGLRLQLAPARPMVVAARA